MKFFLIHGAYGNPKENWFPWLKENLEKEGHEVFIPKFPTPENQTLENWGKIFDKYLEKIDKKTIFVGQSLGPAFILSILEKIKRPVKACFFISGFLGKLNNPDFDDINKSFTEKIFNFERIKPNCKEFFIYHSNNDPYVPIEKAEELSEILNGKLKVIENAGHFNSDSGYNKFETLLEKINSIL